jgi:hypothetical protein
MEALGSVPCVVESGLQGVCMGAEGKVAGPKLPGCGELWEIRGNSVLLEAKNG